MPSGQFCRTTGVPVRNLLECVAGATKEVFRHVPTDELQAERNAEAVDAAR
jgi:hypothetical protein